LTKFEKLVHMFLTYFLNKIRSLLDLIYLCKFVKVVNSTKMIKSWSFKKYPNYDKKNRYIGKPIKVTNPNYKGIEINKMITYFVLRELPVSVAIYFIFTC
jgi:hypothetical protein